MSFPDLQTALNHSEMLRQEAMTQARQALGSATDLASNATYLAAVTAATQAFMDRQIGAAVSFGRPVAVPLTGSHLRSGVKTWLAAGGGPDSGS